MQLEHKYYTPDQIKTARNEQGYPSTSTEHATQIARGHTDVLLGVTPGESTARRIAAVSLNAPELISNKPLFIDQRTGTVLTHQEAAALHEQEV